MCFNSHAPSNGLLQAILPARCHPGPAVLSNTPTTHVNILSWHVQFCRSFCDQRTTSRSAFRQGNSSQGKVASKASHTTFSPISTMAASTGKAYAQQLLGRQFKGGHAVQSELSTDRSDSPFAELSKNPPEGISVGLKDDNLFHWTVLLVGPPGTY